MFCLEGSMTIMVIIKFRINIIIVTAMWYMTHPPPPKMPFQPTYMLMAATEWGSKGCTLDDSIF